MRRSTRFRSRYAARSNGRWRRFAGPLVAAVRDEGLDVAPGEQATHGRVAVALVPNEALWAKARPSRSGAADVACAEQCLHVPRLVALASREDECHRLSATLGAQVHLGRETAAGAPECFVSLTAHRPGGVLVGANDCPVDVVRRPVELPSSVARALEGPEHACPHACGCPAAKPIPRGGPRPEVLREVPPRRTRTEDPEDGAHHGAVVPRRPPSPRPLGREQRSESLPLRVGQLDSATPLVLPRFAHTP